MSHLQFINALMLIISFGTLLAAATAALDKI